MEGLIRFLRVESFDFEVLEYQVLRDLRLKTFPSSVIEDSEGFFDYWTHIAFGPKAFIESPEKYVGNYGGFDVPRIFRIPGPFFEFTKRYNRQDNLYNVYIAVSHNVFTVKTKEVE